jgi:protein tyrosine phosphatase type 4A
MSATAASSSASSSGFQRKPTTSSSISSISSPTVVEHGHVRFLITDQPNEKTLPAYSTMLKTNKVAKLVRACDPTYPIATLHDKGIQVYDLNFDDGSPPPPEILKRWLDLVESWFIDRKSPEYLADEQRAGVHCVAGLGRGPVLVAIALIEDGMEPLEAVQFVRKQRKGALNTTQLHWVGNYVRTREKKWNKLKNTSGGGGCFIM